jgi:hypothetical protein
MVLREFVITNFKHIIPDFSRNQILCLPGLLQDAPDILIPGPKYRLAAEVALVQHIVVEDESVSPAFSVLKLS